MGHGGMTFQLKTARLIMVLVNVMFFFIGATLLGEGIELLITRRSDNLTEFISIIESSNITKNRLLSNEIFYIPMIMSGLLLVSIGFLGCSGAITQMQCLLFCYSWIIGIVLIFQTIIIISFVTFRFKLKEQLISAIRIFIRDIYKGPFETNLQSTSFLWDMIMYHFKCCGIQSKNDFDLTTKWNRTNPWWNNSMSIENRNFKYPITCCSINDISNKDRISLNKVISCAINGSDIYEISCYRKIVDTFYSIESIILIIVAFIIIIEMFALVFVLVIYNRNRMERISHVMERLPPSYSSRTRVNNGNLYVQI